MIDLSKLKINGRYLLKDNYYYFFNGGSGFSFKMNGTGFKLKFDSCPIDSYFYIIVDRDYQNKTKLLTSIDGNSFSFNKLGIHQVDIVKANEANDCTLKLLDFVVDGELLDNDFTYYKKVRVFGDSTIAGYGILMHEGAGSIQNSDSVEDFCYQALYELNTNFDLFSASGWGLCFSIYTCPQRIGIIDFINKVATNKPNDWVDNSPIDLLIISLGTNDNSFIQDEPALKEERIKEYIDNYKKLIDSQIRYNKDLKILMVYGTLNEKDAYYLNEETYKCLKPLYKNLYIHKFAGDSSAISNHAYVTAHKLMAEELKTVIKSLFD